MHDIVAHFREYLDKVLGHLFITKRFFFLQNFTNALGIHIVVVFKSIEIMLLHLNSQRNFYCDRACGNSKTHVFLTWKSEFAYGLDFFCGSTWLYDIT